MSRESVRMTVGNFVVIFEEHSFRPETQELHGTVRIYKNQVLVSDTFESFIDTNPGSLRELIAKVAERRIQELW